MAPPPPLAIFDLDNTLLDGDSDYLWGRFLVEKGRVDGDVYERENNRFYTDYKEGRLDIFAFLAFSMAPLAKETMETLAGWHREFMEEKIRPTFQPKATALIEQHRRAGETLLIITATNRFVTEPIAEALGIPHLLATDLEIVDGRYTGKPSGTPCFQGGKVTRLDAWLKETGHTLAGSSFYSDSHNDIPLLEKVDRPVAVDPDPALTEHAEAKGWEILSLRSQPAPSTVNAARRR